MLFFTMCLASGQGRAFYTSLMNHVQNLSSTAPSSYESKQGFKLEQGLHISNRGGFGVRERDSNVERDVLRHYDSDSWLVGKSILCVGARLGGEVRAFTRLGALAIGVDLNPGVRNPWSLWGTASSLQFANGTWDAVYTNILDHITPRDVFLCEVARVLKVGGSFFNFVDQGKPDSFSVHDYRTEKEIDLVRKEMKQCGLHVVRELRHVPAKRKRRVISTHSKRGTVEFVMQKAGHRPATQGS